MATQQQQAFGRKVIARRETCDCPHGMPTRSDIQQQQQPTAAAAACGLELCSYFPFVISHKTWMCDVSRR